jgi:hypothetical protein
LRRRRPANASNPKAPAPTAEDGDASTVRQLHPDDEDMPFGSAPPSPDSVEAAPELPFDACPVAAPFEVPVECAVAVTVVPPCVDEPVDTPDALPLV